MLTIDGAGRGRYCDGVHRRSFLQIGALGLGFGGMTLADLLRLEAAEGQGSSNKAIINVHLGGGPSHQDMWDLKPEAPIEYRGEFNPIQTNVPGMEICEHLPRLAKMADKFAIARGLVGNVDEHSSNTTQTGYGERAMQEIGGAPSVGAVISKLQGFNNGMAPFVADSIDARYGYLGPKYQAFNRYNAANLLQLRRISADRMGARSNLLQSIDNLRRDVDASGQLDAADAFSQQAVDVVLSGRMAEALNLEKEKPEVRERYIGRGEGRQRENDRFLMARRLVEAGVRCVSMGWGGWDTHEGNFRTLRDQLPALDMGLASLIEDLHERGMAQDVSIAVWGEFGRTPRVNPNGGGGRDHWPRVAAAFLAGGCIQGGRVVGSSDRIAGEPDLRAVHIHEVLSTLYRTVGIDTQKVQIIDPAGRPRYLLDVRAPIRELL